MEKNKRELQGADELRRKAEERLKEKPAPLLEKLPELETQKLIQELRVHQIELEMQNEELRGTQAVLEESKAKYSDLYDFAPVGYLTLNRQGLILEANLTACSQLGKERSFLIDINNLFPKFISKEGEKDLFYQHLRKVFEAKSLETCELELKGNGCTKFYAQLQSIVVKDNLSRCRTAIIDITERKLAEAKVQEAAQIKSEFTSMVSHELRTPLTVIKESVGIIHDGSAGEINAEQKEFLTNAKRNIDRLARLIDDVLDFQKLETQQTEFQTTENNINQVVEEVRESFALVAKSHDLEILVELEEGLPRIFFDRDKIMQVLTNFASNALKVMEKGKVTLKTKRLENAVRVSVEDQGPGIKEEDLPKLFRTFSQLATGNQRKPGSTGLGLAISKQIIDRHKGKIGVESIVGKGATFYFLLPIRERRNR